MEENNSSLNLRLISHVNGIFTVSFSFIGNFLLLYLILKKTPKEMSEYKRILMQTSIVDLICTTGVALAEPIFLVRHGNSLMLANGLSRYLPFGWSFSILSYCFFGISFTINSISVQFVYRYFVLVKSVKFSKTLYTALLIAPTLASIINACIISIITYPTPEKIQIAKEEFGEFFMEEGFLDTDASFIGLASRPDPYVIAFNLFVMAGISYSIIIWCSVKILSYMRENMKHVTQHVKDMNAQLNRTLFAQALAPFCITFIPSLTIVYFFVTKTDAVLVNAIICMSLSWITVINPFLAMWCVKPYRNNILQCLRQVSSLIKRKFRTNPSPLNT